MQALVSKFHEINPGLPNSGYQGVTIASNASSFVLLIHLFLLRTSHERWLCQVHYMPSYEIARSLGITPRCLGLLTGNFNVSVDGKRVNLGLCVKDAQKGVCVPDFAQPSSNNQGWLYSAALTQILQRYKVGFLRGHTATILAFAELRFAEKKAPVSCAYRQKAMSVHYVRSCHICQPL